MQWTPTTKYSKSSGKSTGEIIAPNAEGVDDEGPVLRQRPRGTYASGTNQNLDACRKGRTEWYDYAPPFRRSELPDYSVHHVRGYREPP